MLKPYVVASIIRPYVLVHHQWQVILSVIVHHYHLQLNHVRSNSWEISFLYRDRFLLLTKRILFLINLIEIVKDDPCYPSPCGPNARCNNGICTCLPEYQGNPYVSCRPECVLNDDCPINRACSNNKCIDPCPGTCGASALCNVYNHIPTCTCPEGTKGNAFITCNRDSTLFQFQKFSFPFISKRVIISIFFLISK